MDAECGAEPPRPLPDDGAGDGKRGQRGDERRGVEEEHAFTAREAAAAGITAGAGAGDGVPELGVVEVLPPRLGGSGVGQRQEAYGRHRRREDRRRRRVDEAEQEGRHRPRPRSVRSS